VLATGVKAYVRYAFPGAAPQGSPPITARADQVCRDDEAVPSLKVAHF